MKYLKPEMLKAFLSNFEHTLNNKPNGQNMCADGYVTA